MSLRGDQASADYDEAIKQICGKEADYIGARRDAADLDPPDIDPSTNAVSNSVGVALSGGGIRSAIFCLGVLQSLARNGILKYADYLSTVSGGGYMGTSCPSSYKLEQSTA